MVIRKKEYVHCLCKKQMANKRRKNMKKNIQITTTKRGFGAMWECGGGLTSSGSATIITGRNGEARRPVYIPRGGHLACGNHALITVHEGFYIVNVHVSRGTRSSANISQILSVSVKDINGEKWEAQAEVEAVNTFSNGEWDKPLDGKFHLPVEAAFNKASCYHCRTPYYIDNSPKPETSKDELAKRVEQAHKQDEERARLRQEKADAEAKAKSEAEATSKQAKENGLGTRLDAVNVRLTTLGYNLVEQYEFVFKWGGWQEKYYNEKSIAQIEASVEQIEAENAEKQRKLLVRKQFQPKFDVFQTRVEALGLTVEFSDVEVRLTGNSYGQPYSDDGLLKFIAEIEKRECEAIEAKRKAEAKIVYQKRKTEAVELGLPANITIWCRRGGKTHAGDGWVIDQDGQDRANTTWYNPRPRYPSEGDKIWEQIFVGEVVLKWSKSNSSAQHHFEVLHLPVEGLTEAQLERIQEIQDSLEEEWKNARGLTSGIPSPSVGNGWGLK